MKIQFEILAGTVKNIGPHIEILVNDTVIHNKILNSSNNLEVIIDNTVDNIVTVKHKNKSNDDTITHQGKIVEDKFLSIEKLWVDDILLPNLFCFTNRVVHYPPNYSGEKDDLTTANSLYFNGELSYFFKKNFFMWFHLHLEAQDKAHAENHLDPEAEQKFFGYLQESTAEQEIIELLKSRGYSITN